MKKRCSLFTGYPPGKYAPEHAHKVGMIVACTKTKIVDKEQGIGKPGELEAGGPPITRGYLDNKEATTGTYKDGWLRTGDRAILDEEGMIAIADLIKEKIKTKGIGVANAPLEYLLLCCKILPQLAPDLRIWLESIIKVALRSIQFALISQRFCGRPTNDIHGL